LPPSLDIVLCGFQLDKEALRAKRRVQEEELRASFAAKRVRMVDELGRAYATGKKKTSIARVWIR
jgi:small subunit ribosomal protein S9